MYNLESYLPREQSYDYAVKELYEPLKGQFELHQKQFGDILNQGRELQRNHEFIIGFCELVATLLKSKGEPLNEVIIAMYRSFHFSLDVIESIDPRDIRLNDKLANFLPRSEEGVPGDFAILSEVVDYLGERPYIDALIAEFTPDIDPTSHLAHHVEIMAGLLFMTYERQAADQAITAASEALTPEGITSYNK